MCIYIYIHTHVTGSLEYRIPYRLHPPVNSSRSPEISGDFFKNKTSFLWVFVKNRLLSFAPVGFRREPEPVHRAQCTYSLTAGGQESLSWSADGKWPGTPNILRAPCSDGGGGTVGDPRRAQLLSIQFVRACPLLEVRQAAPVDSASLLYLSGRRGWEVGGMRLETSSSLCFSNLPAHAWSGGGPVYRYMRDTQGVRIHRIRDFKQCYFNSIPPTSYQQRCARGGAHCDSRTSTSMLLSL